MLSNPAKPPPAQVNHPEALVSTTVRPQQPARQVQDTAAPQPQIVSERLGDVVVLRPLGTLDRPVVDRLRAMVLASNDPVVIDLDDCVLVDPRCLMRTGSAQPPSDADVRIVCRRLSCRRLLARVGIADRFGVFARLEDALSSAGRSGRMPT